MFGTDLPIESYVNKEYLECAPDTPIAQAARIMCDARHGSIIVTSDGIPVGIWTEHDALKLNFDDSKGFDAPISSVMSSPLKTISSMVSMEELGTHFIEQGVRHFLVINDDGEMLGVISQTDLITSYDNDYFLHGSKVHTVMKRAFCKVPGDVPFSKAVRTMRKAANDAILVEAIDDEGPGIITERDVTRLIAQHKTSCMATEAASRPLHVTRHDSSLVVARNMMVDKHIRHLGIIDESGVLTGFLSFSELLEGIQFKYIHWLEKTLDKRVKDLRLAKEDAENANKAKSEFLASMSHELRTPMNAVLGFAQMLQFNPQAPLSPAQNEHVESILSGGYHLLNLINEILDLAKVEADQMDISLEEVAPGDVLEECLDLTFAMGKPKGIIIDNQFSCRPTALLRTDRQRFKQTLINLLSNAIKYNKDGGSVTVEGLETPDGFLRISVTDTGVGIAKDDRHRVFHMFHRVGADPMKTQEGTGIGLTVTKLLVERLAGRIGFESEKDIGSTFWVEFPLTSNETALIWTDALRIGVDAIDDDHQTIIELLNKVSGSHIDDLGLDNVISQLVDYTLFHFRREEKVMEVCGYPSLEEHRDQHRLLCDQVNAFTTTWSNKRDEASLKQLQIFLRDWLFNHILKVDTTIAPYALGQERRIAAVLENVE